jgi:hypothetical protein
MGAGCQSDADIDDVLNNHWLEIAMIGTYFDFDDYTNPVKTYYENTNFYQMVPNFPSLLQVLVAENEYTSDNSLIYNGFAGTEKFYSINSKNLRPFIYNRGDNSNAFEIFIFLSQEYMEYERSTFTFFDLFGLLGGLLEIFRQFGGYIVTRFSQRLFEFSMISNLYQVDNEPQHASTKVMPRTKTMFKTSMPREKSKSPAALDSSEDGIMNKGTNKKNIGITEEL